MMNTFCKVVFLLVGVCFFTACKKDFGPVNFRIEMRSFVEKISNFSKAQNPNFQIISQNGQELITSDGLPTGGLETAYLDAIDGQAREDIYYGYDGDNLSTDNSITSQWEEILDIAKGNSKQVLCIDYCKGSNMDNAYAKNNAKNYISFSADQRELTNIPSHAINNENALDINHLNEAKNFLYLINTANYNSKTDFLHAVTNTNYDLIVMDLFFNDELMTATDIESLKHKANGGKRLVICYMSIGEAEDYRYYWQKKWKLNKPSWLGKTNPDWKGNYKVSYWNSDWQSIITGNANSYNQKIIDAGFDGVYLDIIDAFEYYENL